MKHFVHLTLKVRAVGVAGKANTEHGLPTRHYRYRNLNNNNASVMTHYTNAVYVFNNCK